MLITTTLICAHILFWVGLYGVLVKRDNIIITMICLELALLGAALLFAVSGLILDDSLGFAVFFYMLTLAGVESALGLSIVIVYYRIRVTVSWSKVAAIKG